MAETRLNFSVGPVLDNLRDKGADIPKGIGQPRAERFARAAGAELLTIPATFTGLVGLAEAGTRIVSDVVEQDPAFIGRGLVKGGLTAIGLGSFAPMLVGEEDPLGDLPKVEQGTISNAFLSDVGRAKFAVLNDPNSSPEAVLAAAESIDLTADMNWGMRNTAAWWQWGSDVAGLDRKHGEFPLDEELFAIGSTSLLGAPRSAMMYVVKQVQRAAGQSAAIRVAQRIAQSTAVRMTARTAELMTPITIPWTKANVAMNFGAGLVITDILRNVSEESSLIGMASQALAGEKVSTPEEITMAAKGAIATATSVNPNEDDPASATWQTYAGYGLAASGIGIALAGAYRGIRPRGSKAGPSFLERSGPSTNLNESDFIGGEQAEQIISGSKGFQTLNQDSAAAIRSATRQAAGEDVAEAIDAAVSAGSRSGLENKVETALTFGKLPDGRKTIPIERVANELSSLNSFGFNKRVRGIRGLKKLGINDGTALGRLYLHARDGLRERAFARGVIDQSIKELKTRPQTAQVIDEIAEWEALSKRRDDVRTSIQQFSDNDLRSIIRAGDEFPEIQGIHRSYAKITDDIAEYRVRTGDVKASVRREWRAKHGNDYVPRQEDPLAWELNRAGPARRMWIRGREAGKQAIGKPTEDLAARRGASINASRTEFDLETLKARVVDPKKGPESGTGVVNNPLDPVEALARYASRVIRTVEHNNLKRTIIDTIRHNPLTKGAVRDRGIVSRGQPAQTNKAGRPHTRVMDKGEIRQYEFGDSVLQDTLDFAPFTVGGLRNTLRRIAQTTRTGMLAPWFSVKGLYWDTVLGFATRRAGRSFGLIDASIQGITGGKIDGRILPFLDPTVYLAVSLGVAVNFASEMMKHSGKWIANELAGSRGVLGTFAQMTAKQISKASGRNIDKSGKEILEAAGEKLMDLYNRTPTGILRNQGNVGPGATWMNHHADKLIPEWRSTNNPMIRFYGTVLESVHNGAKIAFFTQNYAMHTIRNGKKMNNKQMLRLANETRQLSGDMSKSGIGKTYNKIVSTLPYSNVYVQSQVHVARAFKRNKVLVGSAVFNTVMLPAIVSTSMLQKAGPETEDWYYNKLPGWKRAAMLTLPLGRLDATLEILDGTYEFDEADWVHLPTPPEFILFQQGARWVMDMMGMGGNRAVRTGVGVDLAEAGMTLIPQLLPPAPNMAVEGAGLRFDLSQLADGRLPFRDKAELKGGIDPTRVTIDSDLGRNMVDSLTALWGTAMTVATNMVLTGEKEFENEDSDMIDVMGSMFTEGLGQAIKRVPVLGDAWGYRTQYSSTDVTDEYFSLMSDLSTVFAQFDIETQGAVKNASGRLVNREFYDWGNRIRNDVDGIPAEKILSMVSVADTFLDESPLAEQLTGEMSTLLREKEAVINNRADLRERTERLNELEVKRQRIALEIHDLVILPWEEQMRGAFGDDFNAKDFASIVNRSLGP